MIEPDAQVVKSLRDRTASTFGAQYRDFHDIRWHPERGCLCVFEKNLRGFESVRRELRDENGEPRQANYRDVDEVIDAAYGRRESVDKWFQALQAKKAAAKAESKARLRDLSTETAKEIVRMVQQGPKPGVALRPDRG